MRALFEELRKEVLALDPCVSEEILKPYVAYKAETNFVDVVSPHSRLRLSLNMRFHELHDPRSLARDVTNVGHSGNGDVDVVLSLLEDLPYVMGIVRQAFGEADGQWRRRSMIADLKPYPAKKDSGVEWLGAVPQHWEVHRLGTSVHGCINGIWGNDPNGREDLPCVRVADFDRARLRVRLAKPTLRAVAPGERKRRLLKKSDLLLEKSGGGDLQPVGVVMFV